MLGAIQNQWRQKTSVTDSANNPLARGEDQALAGLDDLMAAVLSEEDEQPKKRGRKTFSLSTQCQSNENQR